MIHIKELFRLQNIHRLRLIAGQDGLERTVTEAVLFEYDPSRVQLPDFYRGDLVVTTLAYARGDAKLVAHSLQALMNQGIAGLMVKTAYFSELPQAVITLANRLGTPVFLFDDTYIEEVILQVTDLIRGKRHFAGFEQDVDALIEKGEPKISAIIEIIRCYIKECKPVRFDGNGYSDEWKAEAARRGLDCETSCPLIFDNYLKPASIAMFESTGVMTRKELEARNEVKWETYTKKIQIEARVLGDLAMNHIIPVATEYQSKLIDNVYKMKELFPAEKASQLSAENMKLIEEIARRTIFITEHVNAMVEARKVANKIESEREKAIAYHDTIAPMLEEIRYHIDKLELIVDNQMWTLPKYRELLFIR